MLYLYFCKSVNIEKVSKGGVNKVGYISGQFNQCNLWFWGNKAGVRKQISLKKKKKKKKKPA